MFDESKVVAFVLRLWLVKNSSVQDVLACPKVSLISIPNSPTYFLRSTIAAQTHRNRSLPAEVPG